MTHDQEWQRRIKMVLFGESKKKTGKHHFTWATTKSSRLHRLQACNMHHMCYFSHRPQSSTNDVKPSLILTGVVVHALRPGIRLFLELHPQKVESLPAKPVGLLRFTLRCRWSCAICRDCRAIGRYDSSSKTRQDACCEPEHPRQRGRPKPPESMRETLLTFLSKYEPQT